MEEVSMQRFCHRVPKPDEEAVIAKHSSYELLLDLRYWYSLVRRCHPALAQVAHEDGHAIWV
eukprot:48301-Eustigmatos_ZCMA.PRE.1